MEIHSTSSIVLYVEPELDTNAVSTTRGTPPTINAALPADQGGRVSIGQ